MNLQLAYRYILSLSNNESNVKQNKTTRPRKKAFQRRKSNPRPLTCKGNAMSIEPRQLMLIIVVKLIIARDFKGDREGIPHIHPIP